MLKNILKFIAILILILIVVAIFNREKITRLQKTITLFDKKNIVHNFLHMEDFITTTTIEKSVAPTQLPVNLTYQLPQEFQSGGKTYNVQEFIDRTLTTGLMVIHKDTIIFEKYMNGLTPETTHISWSMAKSFVSGLLGIAVQDGLIESIQDPITKYLPQLESCGYNGVKIKDILPVSYTHLTLPTICSV